METKAKLTFFNYSLTCLRFLWSEAWPPAFLQAPSIIWLLPALGSLLLFFGHRVTDSTGCSGPHPGIPLRLFQVDPQSSVCFPNPTHASNPHFSSPFCWRLLNYVSLFLLADTVQQLIIPYF